MEALLTRAKFRAATRALDKDPADEADVPPPTTPSSGDGTAEAAPVVTEAVATEPEPEAVRRVDRAVLQAVVDDFVPPSYPLQVELQNLVAVMECTSRSMLPERFRGLDREATVRRVEELKRLIGER
jgi:hypothetical protein